MADFLGQLASVELRYEELTHLLSDPAVIGDSQRYTGLMKEYNNLGPLVECWRSYRKAEGSHREARELLDQGGLDHDFRQMVEEELETSAAAMEDRERQLKLMLLPKDPNDQRSVIVEIRGGAGGEEAALFAGSLYRMYTMYAETKGWKTEILNANETELGGFKEVSFSIEGEGAFSRLKFESGVHRVQRVPETESGGRVHTSTATVAVLPEMETVDVQINPADVEMQVFRSSGAGGQHINKTSSAVRLIHKPTGIVVSCQTERSQFQNEETCMKMLRSKLMQIKEQEHLDKISDIKGVQLKIEWGSQIRSYVFMPYQLVKDNRTAFETSNVNGVMDGDLDGFINAYLTASATGELKK